MSTNSLNYQEVLEIEKTTPVRQRCVVGGDWAKLFTLKLILNVLSLETGEPTSPDKLNRAATGYS